MLQDLRFGLRMLRRSPGYSLLAILCLTLGIGATTCVFSWIEGILLRPFPMVANQDRMVALAGSARNAAGATDLSWPDFQDFERNCKLFDAFIVDRITGTTLNIGDRADRAAGSIVSANYFQSLGIRPLMGRAFEPQENTGRNAHPVTVISYMTWKDRYQSDPAIIGKTQMLNGMPHQIVGVMPEEFKGTFVGYSFNFWVPVSMQETFDGGGYKLDDRSAHWIESYAILKPGVTIERAQAEISAVAKRLEDAYPSTNRGHGVKLYPLWATPFTNAGSLLPTFKIALAVVSFVLLIACANVGNLLLVRSFGRRHEMTVRLSIGAGRKRLLKQLLTEGLILSSIAAGAGLLMAYWCRHVIVLMFPPRAPGITINLPAEIDWRVLAISAAICVISTVLFGLAPALQSTKIDLAGALRSEAGGVVGGRKRAWLRSSLVLVQVSLSFVLLVGAGLLVKSLAGLRAADPGFPTHGLLTSSFDLVSAGYDTPRVREFQDRMIERVQSIAGVESAAFARTAPFGFRSFSESPVATDGSVVPPEEQPLIEYNEIGPGFLATMGVPVLSGREFTRADNETAPPVAVVNETLAAQLWPRQDPIGQRMRVKDRWMRIVGVAKVSKYHTLVEPPRPFFYVAMRQNSAGMGIYIRTRLAPESLASALAREVHAIDANVAPSEVLTMRSQVDRTTWTQRAAVTLVGIFGGLALLLAAVGLYGVMSYAVSQSRRELGLRMALGAGASDLLRLVMSHGATLMIGGVVLGAAVSFGLTGLIANLLYKVNPRDPAIFISAFAAMALVALTACLVPAWRATRTDPVSALRD